VSTRATSVPMSGLMADMIKACKVVAAALRKLPPL
jgi:hypothetical protein